MKQKIIYHNGKKINYFIDKENDNIRFDLCSIVLAGLTVDEFMQSDAFLDIVSIYQRVTGKKFEVDFIQMAIKNKILFKHNYKKNESKF